MPKVFASCCRFIVIYYDYDYGGWKAFSFKIDRHVHSKRKLNLTLILIKRVPTVLMYIARALFHQDFDEIFAV